MLEHFEIAFASIFFNIRKCQIDTEIKCFTKKNSRFWKSIVFLSKTEALDILFYCISGYVCVAFNPFLATFDYSWNRDMSTPLPISTIVEMHYLVQKKTKCEMSVVLILSGDITLDKKIVYLCSEFFSVPKNDVLVAFNAFFAVNFFEDMFVYPHPWFFDDED